MMEYNTTDGTWNREDLLAEIEKTVVTPVHLLAVCSGFRDTLMKHRLDKLLPEKAHLHFGPGCPACLLSPEFIDKLTAYSRRGNVIIAVYNDLLGIPGSRSTLEKARGEGADIRVVSRIWDILLLAKKNRRKRVVFPAVGFESAAASTAAAILQAKVAGIFNFQVLTGHRRMLACMETAVQNATFPVHGLITSGRVAASMGSDYFLPVSEKFKIPQTVSGYTPEDLLQAVLSVAKQIRNQSQKVENLFPEAVSRKGNPKSHQLLEEVFAPVDAFCNGFGNVKNAGFQIKNAYRMFDAENVFFDVELPATPPAGDCLCGEIMNGSAQPADCPHFRKKCNIVHALGACMHSAEGPCRTAYLYGAKE
jgi:hydrogenase expression/formation protein HypD